MLCAIVNLWRRGMKQKSMILFLLMGVILLGCTKDESSVSLMQILYYSSQSSALSIDMLELSVIEYRIFDNHFSTISPDDFDFDDQSSIYYTELSTASCCRLEIEFCFGEAENAVVSGSLSMPLDPGTIWEVSIYPFRPPFFYICYDNYVYPVAEEYQAQYGDSLYVKWIKSTIE
jgi:hypothetical protein